MQKNCRNFVHNYWRMEFYMRIPYSTHYWIFMQKFTNTIIYQLPSKWIACTTGTLEYCQFTVSIIMLLSIYYLQKCITQKPLTFFCWHTERWSIPHSRQHQREYGHKLPLYRQGDVVLHLWRRPLRNLADHSLSLSSQATVQAILVWLHEWQIRSIYIKFKVLFGVCTYSCLVGQCHTGI